MCELPEEIDGTEKLFRAVFSPFHVSSNGKLKPAAFRPSRGAHEISVMRHDYLGSDLCKAKSIEMAKNRSDGELEGAMVIVAQAVRDEQSNAYDAREDFWGHAHVSHGITVPDHEAQLTAEESSRLNSRLRALANRARFFPERTMDILWAGDPI